MRKLTAFLLTSTLIFPALSFAAGPAGQVIISMGSVNAVSPQGASRTLKRGDSIFSGDTIKTSTAAKVQLRFTDNTLVSLSEATEFKVKNYQLSAATEGKVAEYMSLKNGVTGASSLPIVQNKGNLITRASTQPNDRMIVALAKGGLRMVTGAIGKSNPGAYSLGTTVGTIAVRGTTLYGHTYNSKRPNTFAPSKGLQLFVPDGNVTFTPLCLQGEAACAKTDIKVFNIGAGSGFTNGFFTQDARGRTQATVSAFPGAAGAQVITLDGSGTKIASSTLSEPTVANSSSSNSGGSSSGGSGADSTPSATSLPASNPVGTSNTQQSAIPPTEGPLA